jgi:hypothetical protein
MAQLSGMMFQTSEANSGYILDFSAGVTQLMAASTNR